MTTYTFRCSNTGLEVHGRRFEPSSGSGDSFAAVRCIACDQTHHLDPATGKLLDTGTDSLGQRATDVLALLGGSGIGAPRATEAGTMASTRRASEDSVPDVLSAAAGDPHASELEALREENRQLRELVIQLSKLVVK